MKSLKHKGRSALIASCVLLGALAVETALRPKAADAEPHHERVRVIAAQAPLQIGDWAGTENAPTVAEVKLLKPNVILSRRYVNSTTRRSVSFLIVQCKDARDLNNHYPPVCYPNNGMPLRATHDAQWTVAGVPISGKRYEFDERRPGEGGSLVYNFLIVPGRYAPNMDAVGTQAGDYTRRYFGAAQVQVVFNDSVQWTQQEQDEVFETFITAYLPLIEAIRKAGEESP